jgi:hypothetical protein
MPRLSTVDRAPTRARSHSSALCAIVLGAALGAATLPVAAESADVAALRALVEAQAKELQALRTRLEAVESGVSGTQQRVQIAEEQLDATVDVVERLGQGGTSGGGEQWFASTTLAGYGELHYNNLDADAPNRDLKEADFHRFVVFLGHRFSDRLAMHSEIEIEHAFVADSASGSNTGELELEQAFVDYRVDDAHVVRAGQFLLPFGILNETHEPPTFFGVERNDVENVIIPGTWWEAGIGASGSYENGLGWDLAVHSGLKIPVAGSNAFRVRSGRQKVANASARDLAYSGRLRYRPMPGLDLTASVQYQGDASQVARDGLDEAWLYSLSGDLRLGGFGLRALWSEWKFEGDAIKAAGVDEQNGWYVEPSWRFGTPLGDTGVYVRFSDVDGARTADRFEQWEFGVNYWPIEDVVLKADVRRREHDLTTEEGRDFDGFDLSIGYQF